MDNSRYIEFVEENTDKIAEYVNSCFEQSKEFIKAKIVRELRGYLDPIPVHYKKVDSYNTYDNSGELREDGYVSLNQTVADFLENEYSGNKVATFTSGMGWHYNSYEDELHYLTIEIAAEIMFPAIQRYIEKELATKLSENEFEIIQNACGEFDDIYDNCVATDFFNAIAAAEFVGIRDTKLKDVKKHHNSK